MLFSVIIPTFNRPDLLEKCLENLSPGFQTMDHSHYEVIVSNDGEFNSSFNELMLKYPWVRYVAGPKKGPAANRNTGALLATTEWLAFTDDDCLPDSNWLSAFQKAIDLHPECRAFEGKILPDDWTLLKRDMAECPVNDKGECFWSANIVVSNEIFQSIGGFDEAFKIAAQEDQDLFLRLKQVTKTFFVADSIVTHPVRIVSLKKKLDNIPAMFNNWIYYIQKHNPDSWHLLLRKSSKQHLKLILNNGIHFRWSKSFFHLKSFFHNNKLIRQLHP